MNVLASWLILFYLCFCIDVNCFSRRKINAENGVSTRCARKIENDAISLVDGI